MTRHSVITVGRGAKRRAVRVEHKRRAWTQGEIRGAGVKAVGDALFRMGGSLSGADVLRILTAPTPKGLPHAVSDHARALPPGSGDRVHHGRNPDLGADPRNGMLDDDRRAAADRQTGCTGAVMPGALANDVCRHIRHGVGRFADILWG